MTPFLIFCMKLDTSDYVYVAFGKTLAQAPWGSKGEIWPKIELFQNYLDENCLDD